MQDVILLLVNLVHLYSFLMFLWILLSWFPDLKYSAFYRFLDKLFLPFLEPFRKVIPPINGLDISPILGFIFLNLITKLLIVLGSYV